MSEPHVPTSNELAQERTDLAGQRTKAADSRTHLADQRTDLAVMRTLLALDRTLMAWVRTGTSLISFGFTLYKFLQALQTERVTSADAERLIGPRGIALVLIGLGVGGLLTAVVQYRQQVQSLRDAYPSYGPFRSSIAAAVATALSGLGVIGFILVFLRQ